MPQTAATTQVKIKPLPPDKVKQIEAAFALLESLLSSEWAKAVAAWRGADHDKRTVDKAPLFARLVQLAERLVGP